MGLADALELTLLTLAKEPARFRAAVLRWHARYCADTKASLEEATAVLGLLAMLEGVGCQKSGPTCKSAFFGNAHRILTPTRSPSLPATNGDRYAVADVVEVPGGVAPLRHDETTPDLEQLRMVRVADVVEDQHPADAESGQDLSLIHI